MDAADLAGACLLYTSDERERANLSLREPARFAAMKQQWNAWNATMLPYPAESYSHPNTAVDRY